MNYEDEIQSILIIYLMNQYGIQNETALFHYLILRSYVDRGGIPFTKNRETKEFIQFLSKELNLPHGERFIYKDEIIHKGFNQKNSLENIVESWRFECSIRNVVDDKGLSLRMDEYIKKQQAQINRYAMNKAKIFKKLKGFEWHWKYYALSYLNSVYKATSTIPKKIEGICYGEEHEIPYRTIEETVDAWVHVNTYERTDTKTINEQDVENYLFSRLDLIEEGLTYVDRQVVVPDGRIDILAKDKDETFVIIELKVVEDKELVWQCMYYPLQIKKMFGASKVRMMTIAPFYSYALQITLEQLGYVELKTFSPKVRLGKIESIVISETPINMVA